MNGYVVDCDFSGARIDLVEFNGADVDRLHLPPWPHFLIRSKAAFAEVTEFSDDPGGGCSRRLNGRPRARGSRCCTAAGAETDSDSRRTGRG
jgi:hypothetical protein